MFTVSEAVRLNEPGDAPQLTPDQVWHALQIRARNGDERFVPPGHRFEVLEDNGDWLTRRVVLHDRDDELQRISFHGGRVVVFDFFAGPQKSVVLSVIETDDEGEHWLRLTFLVEFRALAHSSPEEREIADQRRPMMRRQPGHIIAVARELAREGRL